MRRILLALLICLLPLQSFAGMAMSTKMAGMAIGMTSSMVIASPTMVAAQVPCHEPSQPDTAASQDCCGLQGMCYRLCQVCTALPAPLGLAPITLTQPLAESFVAAFQSADLRAGLKPPLI